MNGNYFISFVRDCLLPTLHPFNGINSRSVVTSLYQHPHVEQMEDLIETQAESKFVYLSPYSIRWRVCLINSRVL
jgi:hypothetical protein